MSNQQPTEQVPEVEVLPPNPPTQQYPAPQYQYPTQPQYPNQPYQPPSSDRPWDERATDDITQILDFINNPWQAMVMIAAIIAFVIVYFFKKYGKEGITMLKEIKEAPILNGEWDELKKTVEHIDEEVSKNTKKNERDFKRWEAYCANARNKKKAECMIPFD